MTTNGTGTTDVEGIVSRVNERGVLLEGHSAWLNVSKFSGGVLLPEPGARVRLTLDKAGFIRGIETLVPPVPLSAEEPAARLPLPAPADRDTRISRLACLNTATAILSSGGRQTDLAAVLAVAEELEAWVLR